MGGVTEQQYPPANKCAERFLERVNIVPDQVLIRSVFNDLSNRLMPALKALANYDAVATELLFYGHSCSGEPVGLTTQHW